MPNTLETAQTTRRGFLGAAALTAAQYNRVLGANDRVGIGFIGYGLIGKQHIMNFKTSFPNVDRVAVCDVYKPRVEEGLAYLESPNAKGYSDFRKMYENKDIDGVVVATPDHWHALLTIMACAAGKDVYVEKPLTVFIDEGKWMIQAMNKYKRVVVVGTQRNHNPGHQVAKKVIESGVLGKIQMVKLGAGGRNIYPGFGKTPIENPPADFDYDLWLGPSPKTPYQKHRGLYHFRWFWNYSGGQLTNLGAHSVSAFLLVTGVKGPTKVVSFGGRFTLEDDGETPDLQECLYQFPDFMMTMGAREANGLRDPQGSVVMGDKGNLMLGSNQVVPEMKSYPPNLIPRFVGQQPAGGAVFNDTKPEPWIEAQAGTGGRGGRGAAGGAADYQSLEERMFNANKSDWIECIKSRKQPFCNLDMGHRTAIICNLGNMSLRLGGRTIHWDPEKEVVVGDKEAAAMCNKPYRAPWDGVLKSLLKV
ncbi:MAG: Gfo/Idh/MocA family protein [Bryobacteraceae bacterium]|jgi:predicted dehydrogenase